MRRGIALATAAGLALTLAACGNDSTTDETSGATGGSTTDTSTTAEGDGITITVWTDTNRQPALEEAAKAYEEATGNTVELVTKEFDDIRADFLAQVPTGEGPDITVGAHDWLGELVSNGVVAPLELGDKAEEFNDLALTAFTNDGQVYGLPYAMENVAIIRNTALADSTPDTFDEMIEMGKAAGTEYPFLIQTGADGDPYTYYALQTSFGAPVFELDDNGEYNTTLALGGENGHKFAQWLNDQGETGTGVLDTNMTYDIAVDAFKNGNAPYIVGGPWMVADFEEAGIDIAVDPIPSAGGEAAQPFVGVQGFYLSAQAQNQLAATDFLVNYVATEDVQETIYEVGNRLPAMTSVAEKAAENPVTAGFAEVAADGALMPSIPEMSAVWNYWGSTESQLVKGSDDPAGVWDKMVSDIEGDL
ncbi:MAG: extracellular solute-binding protein [Actinomycetaceae bacterium]|jgi:arabinogalactan oligomer/maltooligosaccharide transport system substrate-binding protein|nr:extracellular solute-binding protein [Actinomycetaceae bacterium]